MTAGLFGTAEISELKQKSVRGAALSVLAQGLTFSLQTGSTIVLARLLSPEDFGLQGMVMAMTGFLVLFRDVGLGVASVQRDILTHAQTSTLFWINAVVGIVVTLIACAMAPFIVSFYNEPRLLLITIASSAAFLFNSLAVQHRALLSRAMRFDTLAKIDVLALTVSTATGLTMAALGSGYWALVTIGVSGSMLTSVGVWMAMPWLPGRPRRVSGVRSMLHIGGAVTLNSLVVYLAYNIEKILLGRFWGAEALGLYGRAYQLANLPVHQLNSAVSTVAFAALSRAQNDAERLRRAFLTIYSVVVSMTIPVVISCAVFAEEIVGILLGPGWEPAATVLRLLAPTILAFSLVDPLGWFLRASGRLGRSLGMALLIAPVVTLGIVVGLQDGPAGVAVGYSSAMVLLIIPLVTWALRNTGMTAREYCNSIKHPITSGAVSAVAGWLFKLAWMSPVSTVPLFLIGLTLSLAVYAWLLLVVMGQRHLYTNLLGQLTPSNFPFLLKRKASHAS